MAKLTDPEIIQALKDGKGIANSLIKDGWRICYNQDLSIFYQETLWDNAGWNPVRYYTITIKDIEADDWQIVPDETSTT